MPTYPVDYSAIYRDAFGEEHTTLTNHGHEFTMTLRGIEFSDTGLDGFTPIEKDADLSQFALRYGMIDGYSLTFSIPINMLSDSKPAIADLIVTVRLNAPDHQPDDRELNVQLVLVHNNQTFKTPRQEDFERALLKLAEMLPSHLWLTCCITCAWSDYSPYGNGNLGNLACFRDAKEQYSQVKGKVDIFALWDRHTEFVQETHLCDQYAIRQPNTGYRG